MGRGRGKGKKSTAREDVVNGEEDKVRVQKRRGRPQKLFKGEIDEEMDKMEEVEENPGMLNEKKRRTSSDDKGGIVDDLEDGNVAEGPVRSVGFRQNGSRRKNKPRRAAEVGVECN